MAVLNTLRSKGGTILAVVIGLSLLAFLLGDFASSGGTLMNASKMNVGEIDGEKIPYQVYLSRVEQLTRVQQIAMGTDALNEQQTEAVKAQAWEQIVRERSFDPGLKALGLGVSEQEQVDMADGNFVSPVLAGIFVNRETGAFDRNMLRQYVANIAQDPTGRARAFWNYLETEMVQERMMSKYMTLVAKGMFVTDLEVAEGVQNANTYYNARFVTIPYASVPDSTVKVTEADMKAYYDRYKRMFRQGDARDIEYVIFDAVPSEADYAEAKKYVESLTDEFQAAEDVQQFVSLNSQMPFDHRYYKREELSPEIGAFAFGPEAAKGRLYGPVFENDVYTLARVTEVRDMPDTIGARHILLPATRRTTADSLVEVLGQGGDFAELAVRYSIDANANKNGGELGRFNPNDMIPAFSEAALRAKPGEVFTVETPYGVHVVELTYRGPAYPKAQLGIVRYKVESSNQTQQAVYAQASKFATQVNADPDNFNKVVNDNALSKRVARLKSTERNVPGIEQSTELVRWAFDAKAGAVSPVIVIGEKNIVARVTGIREFGIAPLEQVKPEILPMVTALKKGEMIDRQLEGLTSLQQIARKFDTEVKTSDGINFVMFYAPEIGVEPEVIGAVAGVKKDVLSTPVNGYSGVYVVEVNAKEVKEEVTPEVEKALLRTAAETNVQGRTYEAVFDMSRIKDMRVKFF